MVWEAGRPLAAHPQVQTVQAGRGSLGASHRGQCTALEPGQRQVRHFRVRPGGEDLELELELELTLELELELELELTLELELEPSLRGLRPSPEILPPSAVNGISSRTESQHTQPASGTPWRGAGNRRSLPQLPRGIEMSGVEAASSKGGTTACPRQTPRTRP